MFQPIQAAHEYANKLTDGHVDDGAPGNAGTSDAQPRQLPGRPGPPLYLLRIVTVLKGASPEVIRIENISVMSVDLSGWRMYSINEKQEHTGLSGTLAPGQVEDFSYDGIGLIWNNSEFDSGTLYNQIGQFVSFWRDQ